MKSNSAGTPACPQPCFPLSFSYWFDQEYFLKYILMLNLHSFTWFQHYILNISGTPEVYNYSITLQIFLLGKAGIAYLIH